MPKAIRSRIFPCHIYVRRQGVLKAIHRSAKLHGGDWATPRAYRCMSCGTRWDASEYDGGSPQSVVCSNCYGERIEIVALKVERVNWTEVMKEADRENRSNKESAKIPCPKCHGSGFTGRGSGYDDVCDCTGGYIGYVETQEKDG